MGSLDNKAFGGVGMVSALLFIVAGALIMMGGESISVIGSKTPLYILALSGILAAFFSLRSILSRESFVQMMCGLFGLLTSLSSAAVAFAGGSADTVVLAAGVLATAAILSDTLAMWVGKIYGAMYISAVLAAVELFVTIMAVTGGSSLYQGAVFVVFALWIATSSAVLLLVNPAKVPGAKAVPAPKSEKSEAKSKPAQAKKPAPKPAAKPEPKPEPAPKAVKQEPQKAPEPKAEPVKVEEPRPEPPKKQAEEPKQEPVKQEPAKPAEPAPAPKKSAQPADFMSRLMSSKQANMATGHKDASAKDDKPAESERIAPSSKPEPKQEPVKQEPAPVEASKDADAAVTEQADAAEVVVDQEPAHDEISEPSEPPVIEEVQETEEPAKEDEPEEQIPEEAATEVEESAEATDDVPEEVPEEPVPAEDEPAGEPEPDEVSEPRAESVPAAEESNGSDQAQPEPVPEDADSADETEDDEVLGEDMFTDYSPEAVVRRAAWNRGLRCRRGYGEHAIPVAFVKGKVAVYVDEPDADRSIDPVLESEGWTVLRFSSEDVTDGKAEGEVIVAAVKANLRSSKAAAKKKKKKSSKK